MLYSIIERDLHTLTTLCLGHCLMDWRVVEIGHQWCSRGLWGRHCSYWRALSLESELVSFPVLLLYYLSSPWPPLPEAPISLRRTLLGCWEAQSQHDKRRQVATRAAEPLDFHIAFFHGVSKDRTIEQQAHCLTACEKAWDGITIVGSSAGCAWAGISCCSAGILEDMMQCLYRGNKSKWYTEQIRIETKDKE